MVKMNSCLNARDRIQYCLKNRAFIVSNEDAAANLIYDMHYKNINTHQRLNENIDIFSEI